MKVLLVCAAGMSTSMLMKKMAKYAEEKGFELEIAARSVSELKNADDWDVVLLGPQVSYQKAAVRSKIGPDKPLDVIPMLEYGRQNCEAIFKRIDGLLA